MTEYGFKYALSMLRALCPTERPVMVRRIRLSSGSYGDCERKKKVFLIRVNKDLTPDFQVWVLIHEYAHAMAWPYEGIHDHEHTAHFGVCYARAYNAVHDASAT